jgi:hypothetical protein
MNEIALKIVLNRMNVGDGRLIVHKEKKEQPVDMMNSILNELSETIENR